MNHSLLPVTVAFILNAANADAASFTGGYDFSGSAGNVANLSYNGASVPDVSFGSLKKVGVTTSASSGNSRASGWSTGATTGSDTFTGTVDLGKYFEFSITANAGFEIDMTSISFGIGRSATGPRQWQWRSSADNYAATIGSYTSTNAGLTNFGGVLTNPDSDSSWTGNVLDLGGTAFDGLSSITFRLYGFNAEGTSGTGGLQGNLTFAGVTTAVPEPASAVLAALGLFRILRRRR